MQSRDEREYLESLGFDANSSFEKSFSAVAAPKKVSKIIAPAQAEVTKTAPTELPHSWEQLKKLALDCESCSLSKSRNKVIFGEGSHSARLMFIGESPNESDEKHDKPFSDEAGQLLTKMIEAMGFNRSDVYIANVVKCRPPNDRSPEEIEMAACASYLNEQIQLLKPEVIVCLGKTAAQQILKCKTPINQLRGKFSPHPEFKTAANESIAVMPTLHPSYLLNNPSEKKHVWADLQMVIKRLG